MAKNIPPGIARRATQAFRYTDWRLTPTIGRRFLLWWTSPYHHWQYASAAISRGCSGCSCVCSLIGYQTRFGIVLMDWAWSYLTFNRTARVVAGTEKFDAKVVQGLGAT